MLRQVLNVMKDYVAVIAAIIAGISAIISAVIAWRLNAYSTEKHREFSLKKEKYDELKDLYTRSYSLFENAIRQVQNFDEFTLAQECSEINAKIRLLAPENIAEQYELACSVLESWSSLYVKASPKRIKIGDSKCVILQSPDPTKEFIEPAKKEYENLQKEMKNLFDLMRVDLQNRT